MTIKTTISFTSTGLTALILLIISFGSSTICHGANITAFGDSLTTGVGSESGGYPPKLNNLLNNKGKPSTVVNMGVGGEITMQGINRFDSVLASFATDIILIMEGINDVGFGLSMETSGYNIQAMIDKAKAAGVTPVLATLTPSSWNGETAIPQAWNPMLQSLAGNNGIRIADQYAVILPTWSSITVDGIHPNDSGYQIIANTWYSTIASMISSSGAIDPTGTSSSGGSGGGGGGCFIATAAFGSPVERHVVLLKEFRDTCLLTNSLGRHFVEAYYHYSPSAADFISRHDNVKLMVRVFLYPLITFCYLLLKLSLTAQLVLSALAAISCLALSALVVRNRRNGQMHQSALE